jgi:hypothetical protein
MILRSRFIFLLRFQAFVIYDQLEFDEGLIQDGSGSGCVRKLFPRFPFVFDHRFPRFTSRFGFG